MFSLQHRWDTDGILEKMRKKENEYKFVEQKKSRFIVLSSAVSRMVSVMGIAMGMTGVFLVLGGNSAVLLPVFAAAAAAAVIAGVDLLAGGKSYGVILCLLAAAMLFFSSVSHVLRAVYVWSNHILGLWNRVFDTFYGGIQVSDYTGKDLETAGVILALLGAAAASELVRRKSLLLSLLVFSPLCLGMLLSIHFPVWMPALLIAGWLAAWLGISSSLPLRWEAVVLTAGVWAALVFCRPDGFVMLWQRAAGQVQAQIKQEVKRIRFGEDTLPEGNLMKADHMLSGDEERLLLEMQEAAPIYLRGYIGAVYEGNTWQHFPAESYGGEYFGMLSWLAGQGVYPGAQYAAYQDTSSEESARTLKVSVNNIGANRRYVYLPATVAEYPEKAGQWKQDWSMESSGWFGKKEYAFTYYDVQSNAEVQAPASWVYQSAEGSGPMEAYRRAERIYRSFVYDHYLDLEEEQRELLNHVFFQGDYWDNAGGVYSVTSRIRTVLRILAQYQAVPARVPADQEFLNWFIHEGKEGNAAYYATAAVLAYRAAGIPARYAEGYILTKRQAEQTEGNTVVLSGKNAHAWAEVYVDGIGWRAVEVTPGFYEELYQADIIVAVPNEELEGAGEDGAGILASEEYEFPESEEEQPPSPAGREGIGYLLLLLLLTVFLLANTVKLFRILFLYCRYRRMGQEEKMFFLFRQMLLLLGKMDKEFNPQRPLDVHVQDQFGIDQGLYQRTVARMERIIYGQQKPAERELPAAEKLTVQIYQIYRKQCGWRRIFDFGPVKP